MINISNNNGPNRHFLFRLKKERGVTKRWVNLKNNTHHSTADSYREQAEREEKKKKLKRPCDRTQYRVRRRQREQIECARGGLIKGGTTGVITRSALCYSLSRCDLHFSSASVVKISIFPALLNFSLSERKKNEVKMLSSARLMDGFFPPPTTLKASSFSLNLNTLDSITSLWLRLHFE